MIEQAKEQWLEMCEPCTCSQSLEWLADMIQEALETYPRAVNPSAAVLKVGWEQTDWWDIAGDPEAEERWHFWRDHEVEVRA